MDTVRITGNGFRIGGVYEIMMNEIIISEAVFVSNTEISFTVPDFKQGFENEVCGNISVKDNWGLKFDLLSPLLCIYKSLEV